MKQSIIIGIHGLSNKPSKAVLEGWWSNALTEGLVRNQNGVPPFSFSLVYWADIRNKTPISSEEDDEPYIKSPGNAALRRYDPQLLDKARAVAQKWGGRMLDKEKELIGLGSNVEKLLGVKFDDLAEYYAKEGIREDMRSRLKNVLEQHRDKKILLIAHSMGTIIAYDVLRALEKSQGTPQIEHFVTLGSPLGLPLVVQKIREEFGNRQTPLNVLRWTNFADPGDKVALDCNLADDFQSSRDVIVRDTLVYNNYVSLMGKANNHKIYGYLRCPELSEAVNEFLGV